MTSGYYIIHVCTVFADDVHLREYTPWFSLRLGFPADGLFKPKYVREGELQNSTTYVLQLDGVIYNYTLKTVQMYFLVSTQAT